jgi:hypothetical protein
VLAAGLAEPQENRSFSWRSIADTPISVRRSPSQPSCVEPPDLASVSSIMRSFSKSVRRTHAPVSANLRQKVPLIARRAVHHCASLQITCLTVRGASPGKGRATLSGCAPSPARAALGPSGVDR